MIRMEVPDWEPMTELNETVREYWGKNDVVFVRDYELLDGNLPVGDVLREGDVIDAIPNPRCTYRDTIKGRVQYKDGYGGAWSEGSGQRLTS